jgi:hypothetical protein
MIRPTVRPHPPIAAQWAPPSPHGRREGSPEHLARREREGPAPKAGEGEGLRCFRPKRDRSALTLAGILLCAAPSLVFAQDAPPAPSPAPVQVEALSQLDFFSTGRDAGLGEDVWKGSSADIARAVIPTLASKPLSPAAASLARRLLAQTSIAPQGAGADLELAVARARALLALGDADDAFLIMDRTPGVAEHADLSQLAADAALIGEQDDRACAVADNLTDGRDGLYWLRLRAFCLARAGRTDEAQLSFNLAGSVNKDPVVGRLLGAFIAGGGDPGPASLRTGLDYALSRALKLDLAPAMAAASPAISRNLALASASPSLPEPSGQDAAAPTSPVQSAVRDAVRTLAAGNADAAVLRALVALGAKETNPKSRARAQAAAAFLASLGRGLSGPERAELAGFELGRAEASPARLLALAVAADMGLKGETALLALRIAQVGGAAGPGPADRCSVIRALDRAGLKDDARAFAVEGLLALAEPG